MAKNVIKLNKLMAKQVNDLNKRVRGKKIRRVLYVKQGDMICPTIQLEDGTCFTTQADDEGNGPGVLVHYGDKDLQEIGLWEIS